MALNHKQEEIIAQLAQEIEGKFPEIKFVEAVESLEGENTWWLHFTQLTDDNRFNQLVEFAGGRAMDILENYGYHFMVLPVVENGTPSAIMSL